MLAFCSVRAASVAVIYIHLRLFIQLFSGVRKYTYTIYNKITNIAIVIYWNFNMIEVEKMFHWLLLFQSDPYFNISVFMFCWNWNKWNNNSGFRADIKQKRFQALIKRPVDRNVHISGVMARGCDPSSWFHRKKIRISVTHPEVSLFKALGSFSLHFYLWLPFGTQPHICNQETSVIWVLESKNNPSQTAFYRYCHVQFNTLWWI